ncbi:vesicle-associated membrane protein 4 isoform X2 [Phyllobates terribilis]|uniref:vesicle-associated membrane protein 4 isoform X2 n=1 Tax=Phyllobates terribilis TaxID=111132 RepID=UPI003CCA8E36
MNESKQDVIPITELRRILDFRTSVRPLTPGVHTKEHFVQNQVDEVIDVMQENITKVIERGERLDELQDKSESLSDNATAFSSRARQLRRQMWWRECKMKAIVALVFIFILLVIIVPIILKYRS